MGRLDHLWAKDPHRPAPYPLTRHLLDSVVTAGAVWDHWLRPGLRTVIADILDCDEPTARRWVQLAAGLHDVGKANPAFQMQERFTQELRWRPSVAARLGASGLSTLSVRDRAALRAVKGSSGRAPAWSRHEYVGHVQLTGTIPEDADPATGWLPLTVAGHHGWWGSSTTSEEQMIGSALCCGPWQETSGDVVSVVEQTVGLDHRDAPEVAPEDAGTLICLVTGLVVLADWAASNETCVKGGFRLLGQTPEDEWVDRREGELAEHVRGLLGTYSHPSDPRSSILGRYEPRPVQQAAIDVAAGLGLWTVMQATGEGKTEAALLRHTGIEDEGLIFALPTRATTDAMQARLEAIFADTGNNVLLSHQLSARHEGETVGAEHGLDWYSSAVRRLVAPVTTCTVDQVLAGALHGKHSALRLLALANHHVVLDEVHTLDHYQTSLLTELLAWWGRTRTRVTLLSATLPDSHRQVLESAYTAGGLDHGPVTYPGHRLIDHDGAVTAQSGLGLSVPVPDLHVVTTDAPDGTAEAHVHWVRRQRRAYPDAHIGVVLSTVDTAVAVASLLSGLPGAEVICLHSRMTAAHRSRVETRIAQRLGKDAAPGPPVVLVGTQVLEASLDIDLDLMSSDLAPAPGLVQRAGRLWRFRDPAARNIRTGGLPRRELHVVRGPSHLPYHAGELERTWDHLTANPVIPVPGGVQSFVEASSLSLAEVTAQEQSAALARFDEARRSKINIAGDLLTGWCGWGTLSDMSLADIDDDLMGTRFVDRESVTFLILDDAAHLSRLAHDRRACIDALDGMVPCSATSGVGRFLIELARATPGFDPDWKALSRMRPVLRTDLRTSPVKDDPLLGLVL